MTIARKYLIDYSKTCYYHCMSRCVRQDYFLGAEESDSYLQNYRKDWIQRRLLFLADIYAIDLLAFSIMDNHTHLVLHANHKLIDTWSNTEVLKRWSKLGRLPMLCERYLSNQWREKLNENELMVVLKIIDNYRRKLIDISGFMSHFNSYISRRANREDKKKGHFWDGRFKSQALQSASSIFRCMLYVDLNPIRAGRAKNIEQCRHTSLKKRIHTSAINFRSVMLPLRSNPNEESVTCNMSLQQYMQYARDMTFKKPKSSQKPKERLNSTFFEESYTLLQFRAKDGPTDSYLSPIKPGNIENLEVSLCLPLDMQYRSGKRNPPT